MSRRLIYVVGPSGAGKDSVMQWIKRHVNAHHPDTVHCARRTITRASTDATEAHEYLDVHNFLSLKSQGEFAMHWQANGLHYGIRHRELTVLEAAGWVFANGSRSHLEHAIERFPELTLLHVTADQETLRQRLKSRARESDEKIEARLRRNVDLGSVQHKNLVEVDNSGSLEMTGHQVIRQLAELAGLPIRNLAQQ
jgi:ribose 1,5-bisphosphokinase